jgi:hypothetical protein
MEKIMNTSANQITAIIRSGLLDLSEPEQMKLAQAAFPIHLDRIVQLIGDDNGNLLALGKQDDDRRILAWTCPDDVWESAMRPSTAIQHGWMTLPDVPDFILEMRKPGGWQRLREALTLGGDRLRRAGLALKGDL